MAIVLADNVKETSIIEGTGTLNLIGAETGFQTFVAGVGGGVLTAYSIFAVDTAGNRTGLWETGLGTVTDAVPDTLSRDVVIDGSSGKGVAVSFTAGTKEVILSPLAHNMGGGCRLKLQSNFSVANAVQTNVDFVTADHEIFDVGGFHEGVTNPERITVPNGFDGKYIVTVQDAWASNATGTRQRNLRQFDSSDVRKDDGADVIAADATLDTRHTFAQIFQAVAGDYWIFRGRQTSGGALDLVGAADSTALSTAFSAWRIGP